MDTQCTIEAEAMDSEELDGSRGNWLKRGGMDLGRLADGRVEILQTSIGLVEKRIGGYRGVLGEVERGGRTSAGAGTEVCRAETGKGGRATLGVCSRRRTGRGAVSVSTVRSVSVKEGER